MRRGSSLCARAALAVLLCALAAASAPAAVGGGWSDGGAVGDYFANPDLGGQPAFTRKEVRIACDWRPGSPVGGSTSAAYASFPNQGFSVRWHGTLISRFSETYTIAIDAADGVRARWRTSRAQWADAIDAWDGSSGGHARIPSAAGEPVELEISYRQRGPAGHCQVRWSSPSTPEEVIDPVAEQGLMLALDEFADLVKTSAWQDPAQKVDEHGYASTDAVLKMHGNALAGTYLLRLGGKAEVALPRAVFTVGTQAFTGTLPSGSGYDQASNTTTALACIDGNPDTIQLQLTKTSRDGSDRLGTGNAFIQFMRPLAPGAQTPHAADQLFYAPIKSAVASTVTARRWCTRSLCWNSGSWADRKRPADRIPGQEGWGKGRSDCFEDIIMFANETGRDVMMSMSSSADNEYFLKLAKLMRYGSDGENPYDGPQEHPRFPPLNTNLRLYLELGNEIWNWASPVTIEMMAMMAREEKARTEDGAIFNYNGKGNYRTWHALRTARASDIFRGVFGDAAMGGTVRFLIEYQYSDAQATGFQSFAFLDSWFNNGDGQHVATPHPVNHYIWGAGGAAYYGRADPFGERGNLPMPDPSFEAVALPELTTACPAGTPWHFTGGAGIYRNLNDAVAKFSAGKAALLPPQTAYGMRFTVGDQPITVHQLGQWYHGNADACRLLLTSGDAKEILLEQGIGKVTRMNGFHYAERAAHPVLLAAHGSYCLVALSTGKASIYRGCAFSPGPAIHADGPILVPDAGPSPASWKFDRVDGAQTQNGPVTLLYSTTAESAALAKTSLALPQPCSGTQAAIIRGAGSLTAGFEIPADGAYAISFSVFAQSHGFSIAVDGKSMNPRSQGDYRSGGELCAIGGFARRNDLSERYGSGVFQAAKGTHQLSFSCADADPTHYLVVDDIHLASEDSIMESGFGSGEAGGEPIDNMWKLNQYHDTEMCLPFGLARVSYESGWSLGGDFTQRPIQNWCKFLDARGETIQREAHALFMSSDAFLPFWGVYNYFPFDDAVHADGYPIMHAIAESGRHLPAEADNGVAIPGTLTSANRALKWDGMFSSIAALDRPGRWMAWAVIAPATANERITVTTTAGGSFELEVDGRTVIPATASGGAASCTAMLTRGAHGIRLRSRTGSCALERIIIDNP